jgi:predicted TIM-barrel fold metal-dependent hydrolase
MRIVTLEEHISFPEMSDRLPVSTLGNFGQSPVMQQMQPKLADVTGDRLKSMDANSISMQVLSVDSAGANALGEKDAPAFARDYNNLIAEKIKNNRDRFTAFANLPAIAPDAAADELERTVTEYGFRGAMIRGMVGEHFMDHPRFAPVFERAERLGVPIYLHPGIPPKSVADIYYSGINNSKGMFEPIACYGWGWHAETAIHVLRLLAAGVFDRYPKLNIIIGHMGEMLPFMMARSERAFKPGNGGANQRTLIETFKAQLYITTSGFFTQPPFRLALDTFGIDNILFSIDYPFSANEMGIEFLKNIDLPEEQIRKIAYENADRVLGLKA